MGMNELGYYEKSYRLMMLPLQNITHVLTPVLHPVFSDLQSNTNQLAISYERIIKILAFIGFPLSIFLFFIADEAVLIFFGNQWQPSIPIFKILTLSVGFQIISSSSGSIFQAAYDTRSLFICGLFSAILNVSGIMIGVFYFENLQAIAWCIVITFAINFIQCYFQMYKITLKRKISIFMRILISPMVITTLIGFALYFVNRITTYDNIFLSLFIKTIITVIIFGLYIQFTHEYDIIGRIKRLKRF